LANYVGFTEDKVKALCRKYEMDFSKAQRWYDGYGFKNLKRVYCPNSVTNVMLDGGYNGYWTGTFENDMTKNNSRDDALTILIHLGYLGNDADREEAYIPNEKEWLESKKVYNKQAFTIYIL